MLFLTFCLSTKPYTVQEGPFAILRLEQLVVEFVLLLFALCLALALALALGLALAVLDVRDRGRDLREGCRIIIAKREARGVLAKGREWGRGGVFSFPQPFHLAHWQIF